MTAARPGAALTSIVIPTIGRASLGVLLEALAGGSQRPSAPVLVVDDRRPAHRENPLPTVAGLPLVVLASGGRGPAAARNVGWRRATSTWVSFLDDDVVPDEDWYATLLDDLAAAPPWVSGSQGNLRVPLPARRPTDWERSTRGLEDATWITADMSYRRAALSSVGGFDERFPRAYREDADLGLRVTSAHGRISRGNRSVSHPVRPADDWVSVRQQAGNADDVLMSRLHGRDWRRRAGAPPGRRRRHVATTTAAVLAVVEASRGRWRVALPAALAWAASTTEFAAARIAPGPRDAAEVRRMVLTSVVIPVAATWHTARGLWRHRRPQRWHGLPELVLFDRDGTLVHDVPYNGDPELVRPVAGAREALDRLRAAGIRVGIVTNQSGVASGRLTPADVSAVHARVAALLGPFDTVQCCPHGAGDGCGCRKPAPGMVKQACADLDVSPSRCVVVGDIGSDVQAAEAAGATGVLVPTAATRREEVDAASVVRSDLRSAVDELVAGRW